MVNLEDITKGFSKEEFTEILKHATRLCSHGYFTGVNFIKSEIPLPKESVIVHFLQNSKKHLEVVQNKIKIKTIILPRNTFYFLDPKYFEKPSFDEDYKNSKFFDETFSEVSSAKAKEKKEGISVEVQEFDLLIPLNVSNLEETIKILKEADEEQLTQWMDPVVIVKSKNKLMTLPGFVNDKTYVSLERDCEEIYAILHDKEHSEALEKYYQKLCKNKPKIGKLDETS